SVAAVNLECRNRRLDDGRLADAFEVDAIDQAGMKDVLLFIERQLKIVHLLFGEEYRPLLLSPPLRVAEQAILPEDGIRIGFIAEKIVGQFPRAVQLLAREAILADGCDQ